MRIHTNWKLIALQIGMLFLVMWIDNLWLDIAFMVYIIWDLLRWAHINPSPTEVRGYLDTRLLDSSSRDNLPIVHHRKGYKR